jgi:type IV pilus assembly protein PilM
LGGLTAKVMDVEAFAVENAFALVAKELPSPATAWWRWSTSAPR